MKREERLQATLTLLDDKGQVDVDELAVYFDVSPETVRRDLSTLSEQALLRKVHGGAVKFQTAQESSFTARTQHNLVEKALIAEYATRFVNSGDSLFINGGTTTSAFARALTRQFDDLVIITNSPFIANEIWNNGQSNNRIWLLGGQYDGKEMDTTGAAVVDQLHQFHADQAFLTVGTVSATQGYMDYRIELAHIIHTMVQQSRRTTVLADNSKLGQTALVTACGLQAVQQIITDAAPPIELAQALEQADSQLHIASA